MKTPAGEPAGANLSEGYPAGFMTPAWATGLVGRVPGSHTAVEVAGLGFNRISAVVGTLLHGVGLGVQGVACGVGIGGVRLVFELGGGDIGVRLDGVGLGARFLLGGGFGAGGEAGEGEGGGGGDDKFTHGGFLKQWKLHNSDTLIGFTAA